MIEVQGSIVTIWRMNNSRKGGERETCRSDKSIVQIYLLVLHLRSVRLSESVRVILEGYLIKDFTDRYIFEAAFHTQ